MGFFDFLKGKKEVKLSQEVLDYANQIDWKELLTKEYGEGSMKQMLQKLALIYKESKGEVSNNKEFSKIQTDLNKLNQDIFNPVVDYKALFDKFLNG